MRTVSYTPGIDGRRSDHVARILSLRTQIDEIHSRSNFPIIVGGTSYYIQNLIFPGRLITEARSPSPPPGENLSVTIDRSMETKPSLDLERFGPTLRQRIEDLPAELYDLFTVLPSLPNVSSSSHPLPSSFPIHLLPDLSRYAQRGSSSASLALDESLPPMSAETLSYSLWTLLQHVDPKMGARWHWKDIRKVKRGLEIMRSSGRCWSDFIDEQTSREGGDGEQTGNVMR